LCGAEAFSGLCGQTSTDTAILRGVMRPYSHMDVQESMKIAMVAPLFESVPPKLYGGSERVVSYLTEELVRQGHRVSLFASADSQTSAQLVPVVPQALRLANVADPFPAHMLLLDKVARAADAFDVIHFNIDYLHFPLCRALHWPHLSTLHGRLDLPELLPLYREFTDMPLVSISNQQREPLAFAKWISTIYHGLPSENYQFQPRAGRYLAFLGRVSPEKGLDQAIEIAKRAGITLRIAAKVADADRDYYEGIAPLLRHPLIDFVGEIGEHEKQEFLGDALALLFPIQWPEPFGLVMIEAMACGTPVIAFPRGSVPEVIVDGESGYIVNDVEQAVAAIEKLDGFDRRRCRREFERRFTTQRMARNYLAAYRHVAREPSSWRVA
jgi:glycosyltransferase involved in cell wall biosynthesis